MEPVPTKEDIEIFRDWLKKVPYLKQDVDDYFISCFIQAAKGRIERAKEVFDNFHNVYNKYGGVFPTEHSLDPLDPFVLQNYKSAYLCLSPELTKDGALVLSGAIIDPDPSKFNVVATYRSFHMLILQILLDPKMPVRFGGNWSGKVKLVWDLKNFGMGHLTQYTPTLVKAAMDYLSSAVPFRLAGIYFVNASPVVVHFVNLMKSFLKKKLADRHHAYSDVSAIKDQLPDYVLPLEMNGTLPAGLEMTEILKNRAMSNRQLLLDWDEEIRKLGKLRPRNQEDIIIGTFKKLQVD